MKLEGVYTPVITPFQSDGSIDEAAYIRMVEHLVASGVSGIIACGTTGEAYALTTQERLTCYQIARRSVSGRVPVLGGVSAASTAEAVAQAVGARKAGLDGLLVSSPFYAVPTEKELAQHCLAIDRKADLPIVLYNYPARTGVGMGREFLDRIGRSASFVAIKETSGDINRVHMLVHDYPNLQLSCGMDDQALEFFAWGARSWIAGGSNCLLAEHIALYRACVVEGDFGRGRRIMVALLPLMQILEQGGKFVQSVKFVCEMQGLPGGAVRPPLRPLDRKLARQLEEVVRELQSAVRKIAPAGRKPVRLVG